MYVPRSSIVRFGPLMPAANPAGQASSGGIGIGGVLFLGFAAFVIYSAWKTYDVEAKRSERHWREGRPFGYVTQVPPPPRRR